MPSRAFVSKMLDVISAAHCASTFWTSTRTNGIEVDFRRPRSTTRPLRSMGIMSKDGRLPHSRPLQSFALMTLAIAVAIRHGPIP